MLRDQTEVADRTRLFLQSWGLKGRFVAEQVDIGEKTFSRFINHKLALSNDLLRKLISYMDDYEQRNSKP